MSAPNPTDSHPYSPKGVLSPPSRSYCAAPETPRYLLNGAKPRVPVRKRRLSPVACAGYVRAVAGEARQLLIRKACYWLSTRLPLALLQPANGDATRVRPRPGPLAAASGTGRQAGPCPGDGLRAPLPPPRLLVPLATATALTVGPAGDPARRFRSRMWRRQLERARPGSTTWPPEAAPPAREGRAAHARTAAPGRGRGRAAPRGLG